jgi:hypothetical protein
MVIYVKIMFRLQFVTVMNMDSPQSAVNNGKMRKGLLWSDFGYR